MKIKTFLCSIVVFFCCSVYGETVVIAGAHWPGFVNPDGTGVYLDQIKRALGKNVEIRWDISEFERASGQFKNRKADALIGAYRGDFPKKRYPITALDIDKPLLAFYVADRAPSMTVESLNDARLSWRKGYSFEHLIDSYQSHYLFDDTERAYNLLLNGKLDAILDYEHNVPEQHRAKLHYIEVLPEQPLFIVFQNDEKGQRLTELYDEGSTSF